MQNILGKNRPNQVTGSIVQTSLHVQIIRVEGHLDATFISATLISTDRSDIGAYLFGCALFKSETLKRVSRCIPVGYLPFGKVENQ